MCGANEHRLLRTVLVLGTCCDTRFQRHEPLTKLIGYVQLVVMRYFASLNEESVCVLLSYNRTIYLLL